MDDKSTTVPERAKQVEDTPTEWAWVEPGIWTDRMLEALERGVKGGKWFSLIDKVYREGTLLRAWESVRANDGASGVDQVTIADYERHLKTNLKRLSESLKDGSYRPKPVRRTWIPKPGGDEKRPLGIPTVEDRIVQTAMRLVIEPIFEWEFAPRSFGFRPGRGCKTALRRVDKLLGNGKRWVVDADIKSYFDTIDHKRLMACIEEHISDGGILELIEAYLKAKIVEEDGTKSTPEAGVPQGGVISPLLANLYLNALDHRMADEGYQMVRYADDFVILCDTRQEAEQAKRLVETWTTQVGLALHPRKTKLVSETEESFGFLGYRFKSGKRYPTRKAKRRFL